MEKSLQKTKVLKTKKEFRYQQYDLYDCMSIFILLQIQMQCENLNITCEKMLSFRQPLKAKNNLHTCGVKKFVQVSYLISLVV